MSMTQRVESFWRWRAHTSRKNTLLQAGAIVMMFIAVSFFVNRFSTQKNQLHILRNLFLQPIFILAMLVLTAFQINLDYMEYKVQRNAPSGSERNFLLRRHKIIPRMYREIYGTDLLLRLWQWRFIYIALAFLALAHWFIV